MKIFSPLIIALLVLCIIFSEKINARQVATKTLLNVKDYGVKGDNIYDDGPAIQKVLDRAGGMNGAIVFFPDGTYQITDPGNGDSGMGKYGLRISSNTTLQLAEKAVLHKNGNDELISNKDQVKGNSNIVITGGTFETASGTDQKWAPGRIGIKFVNVTKSKIKRCNFRHIGNSGVSLQENSNDNIISDCSFTDIYNCAVEVLHGERNIITRNYLHEMGSDGILVNGDDCIISLNRLKNIGQYSAPSLGSGISLGVDNHPCKGNKVLNNTIYGTAAFGIINDRSANSSIEGNTITNTGSAAIKIGGGGYNSIVKKNTIKNTGLSKETKGVYIHSGIIVDGEDVQLLDNKLTYVTGTGIFINRNAHGAIVKQCTVSHIIRAKNDDAVTSTAIEIKANNVVIGKIKHKNIAN